MQKRTIAVVGSESLLGRDVKQVFLEQAPDLVLDLIGDEQEGTILTERDGEPVVISALDESRLAGADAVLLTGSAESGRDAASRLAEVSSGSPVVDLVGALDGEPGAEVRAPLSGAPAAFEPSATGIYIVAHPAAAVLAEILSRLSGAGPLARAVVHAFAPVSERGQEGIDALHAQTVNLLSFKPLGQDVFDIQASFNLLPRYGSEAAAKLEEVESRIARHLRHLLERSGSQVPCPSFRLSQAPVFHGYSLSIWAEFTTEAKPARLIKALASDRVEIRSAGEAPPTNVGVTGQSGMTAGCIEQDRENSHAAWLWVVADNFRIAAENAVALTRLLIDGEGRA